MIASILGACIGVYVLARILRWVVKKYGERTGREFVQHRVRYGSIAAATVIAFLISGVGEGTLASPDYSHSWVYLVAGAIVLALSVGHSFEMRRDARKAEKEAGSEG